MLMHRTLVIRPAASTHQKSPASMALNPLSCHDGRCFLVLIVALRPDLELTTRVSDPTEAPSSSSPVFGSGCTVFLSHTMGWNRLRKVVCVQVCAVHCQLSSRSSATTSSRARALCGRKRARRPLMYASVGSSTRTRRRTRKKRGLIESTAGFRQNRDEMIASFDFARQSLKLQRNGNQAVTVVTAEIGTKTAPSHRIFETGAAEHGREQVSARMITHGDS